MNGDVFMKNKETLDESNFYGQVLEEEKKVDISKPCDPSNPDYPWVSCGIDKHKDKDNE